MLVTCSSMPSIDGASLIHHGVGVGDVIEVGGVVEDEAGVGGAGKHLLEQLWMY